MAGSVNLEILQQLILVEKSVEMVIDGLLSLNVMMLIMMIMMDVRLDVRLKRDGFVIELLMDQIKMNVARSVEMELTTFNLVTIKTSTTQTVAHQPAQSKQATNVPATQTAIVTSVPKSVVTVSA